MYIYIYMPAPLMHTHVRMIVYTAGLAPNIYSCFTFTHIHTNTYIHTSKHTYIHTYQLVLLQTTPHPPYSHTYIQHIETNIHTSKHTYMPGNIHTCQQTYMPANIQTSKHTYVHTSWPCFNQLLIFQCPHNALLHTCIHTCKHAYIPAGLASINSSSSIFTHIHTNTHAHIHTSWPCFNQLLVFHIQIGRSGVLHNFIVFGIKVPVCMYVCEYYLHVCMYVCIFYVGAQKYIHT